MFSPLFGSNWYEGGPYPDGVLSKDAAVWLKTQIGNMEPNDFNGLTLVGFLRLKDQGDFVRMGILVNHEILKGLNLERRKLGLFEVEKRITYQI